MKMLLLFALFVCVTSYATEKKVPASTPQTFEEIDDHESEAVANLDDDTENVDEEANELAILERQHQLRDLHAAPSNRKPSEAAKE